MSKTISTNFMDVNEVAQYCRMTIRTVYNLTSTRKIPFIKPNGGRLLFNREDIDAWLLESTFQPIKNVEPEQVRHLTMRKGIQYK